MTLLEVRELFVKLSGRIDLVDDEESYGDNGADVYIQAGQDMLDSRITVPGSVRVVSATLESGASTLTVTRCFSISDIWILDDYNSRSRLTRYDQYDDFVNSYPKLDSSDAAEPEAFTRKELENASSTMVIFNCPTDEAYTIEYRAHLYSSELSDDTDTSYWTLNHPVLLAHAALYQLVSSYSNREGANDWLAAINQALAEIESAKTSLYLTDESLQMEG